MTDTDPQHRSEEVTPTWHASDYPEYDPDDGWALTLPAPRRGDACVQPIIVGGHTLRWWCFWLTNGYGGSSGTYSDLEYCLRSVGAYVAARRAKHRCTPGGES